MKLILPLRAVTRGLDPRLRPHPTLPRKRGRVGWGGWIAGSSPAMTLYECQWDTGSLSMTNFSPREIVSELDRYIVGQGDAKRAVAIALRNRWRRLQLDEKLREEVMPKNILMIGPTGVGKTEISRRLA